MFEILKNNLAAHLTLTDEQWAFVLSHFKSKITKKNELLLEKGKVSQYLYFVVKGCLRIFLLSDDGQESTRFLIFEGGVGTAFPSFILRQPSAASIQSVEASQLLMISYQDYHTLLDVVPGWERMIRIGLEKDYIEAILRIESLISMDAKDRYAMLMKKNPKLIQRLPNKIVADYLGISQETLSRLKNREIRKLKNQKAELKQE
ncbi:MAG: Crp/Fnr family transcriptional regulator [Sphingobacteriales bacterium]